jgi:hypothetical protein
MVALPFIATTAESTPFSAQAGGHVAIQRKSADHDWPNLSNPQYIGKVVGDFIGGGVGSVSYFDHVVRESYGSLLGGVTSQATVNVIGRSGHLWRARQALKEAAKKARVWLTLGPWPPDSKFPFTSETRWQYGRRVTAFK